jgi:hypothetical protein
LKVKKGRFVITSGGADAAAQPAATPAKAPDTSAQKPAESGEKKIGRFAVSNEEVGSK